MKFDLQLYKLENNSYLVDFKNAGTQKEGGVHHPTAGNNSVKHPLELLEGQISKKLKISQSATSEEEEDVSPFLSRWQVNEDHVEHVQSVYPFLDVCSKLITDIV